MAHEIENGLVVISFERDGKEIFRESVDFSTWTPEQRLWAMANGVSQHLGDRGAGKETAEFIELLKTRWEEFKAGYVPATNGARAARVAPIVRELRAVIIADLRSRRVKAKEAAEMAQSPKEAADALAKATGADSAKIMARWEKAAAARLAALSDVPDAD